MLNLTTEELCRLRLKLLAAVATQAFTGEAARLALEISERLIDLSALIEAEGEMTALISSAAAGDVFLAQITPL